MALTRVTFRLSMAPAACFGSIPGCTRFSLGTERMYPFLVTAHSLVISRSRVASVTN